MIRATLKIKTTFRSPSALVLRSFSVQPAALEAETNFQREWRLAQPYESIPRMSTLQAIRAFLPGGEEISIFALSDFLIVFIRKVVQSSNS